MKLITYAIALATWEIDGKTYRATEPIYTVCPPGMDSHMSFPIGTPVALPDTAAGKAFFGRLVEQSSPSYHARSQRFTFERREVAEPGDVYDDGVLKLPIRRLDGSLGESEAAALKRQLAELQEAVAAKDAKLKDVDETLKLTKMELEDANVALRALDPDKTPADKDLESGVRTGLVTATAPAVPAGAGKK